MRWYPYKVTATVRQTTFNSTSSTTVPQVTMGADSKVRFCIDSSQRSPSLKPSRRALRLLSVSSPPSPIRPHVSYPKSPYPKSAYVTMLLDLDEIPRRCNILACFFTWLALAGYMFLPGTFISIQHSAAFKHGSRSLASKSLLGISTICCVTGILGASWLWRVYKGNYIWLIDRLFM